ncbi:MAG: hypothetical protein IPH07_08340 [Deltaproteobacteria bacterium]|nr:hypothetical protein [Deltaproteobacteria bacterium]MBP7289405.1 hypothetical protein [Nannocystaceae bacterium]
MATDARWVAPALVALGIAGSGCAAREHLTPGLLDEVMHREHGLEQLRVYPTIKFVAYADRKLGEDFAVDGSQGAVQTGYRGQRVELRFPRALPGAIVAVEVIDKTAWLWVTFDGSCRDKGCALVFLGSQDGRFRLHQVPPIIGFAPARVYRRRVAERNLMEPSRIYAKSTAAPVYMSTRGMTVSVSLEIKKRDRVDIHTVVVPQSGVRSR